MFYYLINFYRLYKNPTTIRKGNLFQSPQLTYDLEVDPGISGGRLAEVDAAAVRAPVLLAQVVDPEDGGRGRAGVVFEARARAQVQAVVPVPPDLHPVAAHVVAEW